jgi:DNA-binding transcriptional LysR family regulator
MRLATEDFMNKNKVRIERRMEVGSNEAIKQAVKGALGLAVLSRASVSAEIERGELTTLDVRGFPLMRRWHVAYPAGKNLSHAAEEFRKLLFVSSIDNYGLPTAK